MVAPMGLFSTKSRQCLLLFPGNGFRLCVGQIENHPSSPESRPSFLKTGVFFFPEALSYPEGVEWRPKKGVESQDKAPGRRNIRLRTDCRLRTVNPWAGSHRDTWQSVIECEMYSCLPFILHVGNREHRGWRPVSWAPFKLPKLCLSFLGLSLYSCWLRGK